MTTDREPVELFTETEIRNAITLDRKTVDIIEHAFRDLASLSVNMPPAMQVMVPDYGGQCCVKSAWIAGRDAFAVKLSTIYPPPGGSRFSEANGFMALIESSTGRLRTILMDNGYLTQLRTAAAGAAAARHLAPAKVDKLAVIGAGRQSLIQAQAAYLVRPFDRVSVWARDAAQARSVASQLERLLHVPAAASPTPRHALEDAQLAITATTAREPVVGAADLHPGLHITAVGADARGKREIDSSALGLADLYVADWLEQSRHIGELQNREDNRQQQPRRLAELGDIILGKVPGRETDLQITIADLTGIGVQDTAIALAAAQRL